MRISSSDLFCSCHILSFSCLLESLRPFILMQVILRLFMDNVVRGETCVWRQVGVWVEKVCRGSFSEWRGE